MSGLYVETVALSARIPKFYKACGPNALTQIPNEKYTAKRGLPEIDVLNCRLHGVALVPRMGKPFDALVKGLIPKSSL
jgi:hypothetical protein